MHISLWYVVLVCHRYDVCENYVGSVVWCGVVGMVVRAKADSVSSVNRVQSAFL